jgi:DNA-nicking Smr family endonuclease
MAWSPPEVGEPLKFLRPGHSPDLLRKLRQGQWRVEDELDLHGLNRIQAERALGDFLGETVSQGMRCVRIVHGKGLGVLREALRVDLPARAEVLGFVEAPPAQGGAGAVLVLLKR